MATWLVALQRDQQFKVQVGTSESILPATSFGEEEEDDNTLIVGAICGPYNVYGPYKVLGSLEEPMMLLTPEAVSAQLTQWNIDPDNGWW